MGGVTPAWLAQLALDHAPPPSGWWPLAPGWWGLLIIFITLIATVAYWYTRPTVRLRRIAIRDLKNLQNDFLDDGELARELEHLLRRYALARFGPDQVAKLSGVRWLAFLVEHGGEDLSDDCGANLLRAAYGGNAIAQRESWLSGAQAFIKGNK